MTDKIKTQALEKAREISAQIVIIKTKPLIFQKIEIEKLIASALEELMRENEEARKYSDEWKLHVHQIENQNIEIASLTKRLSEAEKMAEDCCGTAGEDRSNKIKNLEKRLGEAQADKETAITKCNMSLIKIRNDYLNLEIKLAEVKKFVKHTEPCILKRCNLMDKENFKKCSCGLDTALREGEGR